MNHLGEYFVQFGFILFPITLYQLWVFRFDNQKMWLNTLLIGLYGGVSAIFCETLPVHIFGIAEDFQCVPIILSILYGKRKAGWLAIGLLIVYKTFTFEPALFTNILAILIYAILPMIFCNRFNGLKRKTKYLVSILISVGVTLLQIVFIIGFALIKYGGSKGWAVIIQQLNFNSVAALIQLVLLSAAFVLIESIIQDRRIRKRHDSLIKYNPISIGMFDNQDHFIAVNPAYESMTGYKESELIGKSRLMIWPDDQKENAVKMLEDAIGNEIKVNIETEFRHRSGHEFPVYFTVIPMFEQGQLVGYFSMVTDISDLKATEEYMRNSEKLSAIGELAAGIAHEIRNPLTSIKGFLQLVFQFNQEPRTNAYYEIMISELSRIEEIVSEMLVLSKPHANFFQPFLISDKLKDVETLLQSEANMKNVHLNVEYGNENPFILGDGNQLKQVFLNLGKNAIEAVSQDGRLEIKLISQADSVLIQFEDNGPGISDEDLHNIGKPFFTTKETGTGLGFLISKRIVEKHHGTLHISTKIGEGTVVSIQLPRSA